MQLTRSAGVEGGDDQFSRCGDFNCQRCRGDALCPKSQVFFLLFIFYHAFIVPRYKKLRPALAMKRTKPIY